MPAAAKAGMRLAMSQRKTIMVQPARTTAGVRMAVWICIVVSQSNFCGARFSDRAHFYGALGAGHLHLTRRRVCYEIPPAC